MTVPQWAWSATCVRRDAVVVARAGRRRALYVLLAGAVDRFRYLRQGIALLLVFIGAKMLLSPVVELPVTVSLGAIVVVAAGAIAASMWRDRGRPRHGGPEGNPRHEGPRESPRKAAMRG